MSGSCQPGWNTECTDSESTSATKRLNKLHHLELRPQSADGVSLNPKMSCNIHLKVKTGLPAGGLISTVW